MTYLVTLTFQFPAWDEKSGIVFEIEANNKAEAIQQARRQAHRDGHFPATGKGLSWFRAVEAA